MLFLSKKGTKRCNSKAKKNVYVILHWWVVSCWVWKCPSSWCSRTHFASNRLLKNRSKVSLGNLCSRTFMTTHVLRHLFLCIYIYINIYTHAYAYGQMVNAANQEPTYDFIAVGVEDYGGSLFVLNIRFWEKTRWRRLVSHCPTLLLTTASHCQS